MTKDFELETVLSVTTGISCVDNFSKVYDLAYFIFDDDGISPLALGMMKPKMIEHILDIHPELKGVTPTWKERKNLDSWIETQKANFGERLTISQYGEKLPEKEAVKKIGSKNN